MADTKRSGRHHQAPQERLHTPVRCNRARLTATIAAAGVAMVIVATSAIYQPAKIADLSAGIHLYSLLGFLWFGAVNKVDWHLSRPATTAAFRRGAEMYHRLAS